MCCRALPYPETTFVGNSAYLKKHLLNAANPYRILRLTLRHGDHIRIHIELATWRALTVVTFAPAVHRVKHVARVVVAS